jgi:hypothetical protein
LAWYVADETANIAFGFVVCSFGGKWDSFELEKIKQKFNLKQDENFVPIRFGDFQHELKENSGCIINTDNSKGK